jgi:serine/threonine protein kinase
MHERVPEAERPVGGGAPPHAADARPPRRSELADAELLNRGNRRNPDVLLVRRGGDAWVVKDFAPRGSLVRRFLAPRIHGREVRALRALAGHPSVPAFRGWVDALAFAVAYRPGRRMSRKLRGAVPPDFIRRLEEAVAEMHRRGVVHLDLRHRSNVMVDEAGHPVLIDFGSALTFRPGGLGARWLLPWLARIDRGAVRKWRERVEPPAPAS